METTTNLVINMKCRICGNCENNVTYQAKEQMYHMDGSFEYFQCGFCGCLQLSEMPECIASYYREGYYSFESILKKNPFKRQLDRLRTTYAVLNVGVFGRLALWLFPKQNLICLKPLHLQRDSSIVDVGCGAGELIYLMKSAGIENLLGLDPFIEKDIIYDNGLRIEKKYIFDLNQKQDLIMFHHSFEHIYAQFETLKKARTLLKPGGTVLIRVPTVSSYAWRRYGVNWVQLDAPRHLFLHSIKSLEMLGKKAGLEMYHYYYDSWSFQFWGSEQCERGIALRGENSIADKSKQSIFKKSDIKSFERQSIQFNSSKQGDAVSFFFRAK